MKFRYRRSCDISRARSGFSDAGAAQKFSHENTRKIHRLHLVDWCRVSDAGKLNRSYCSYNCNIFHIDQLRLLGPSPPIDYETAQLKIPSQRTARFVNVYRHRVEHLSETHGDMWRIFIRSKENSRDSLADVLAPRSAPRSARAVASLSFLVLTPPLGSSRPSPHFLIKKMARTHRHARRRALVQVSHTHTHTRRAPLFYIARMSESG